MNRTERDMEELVKTALQARATDWKLVDLAREFIEEIVALRKPARSDPYHDGDPTDAPLFAAQWRKLILKDRDLYSVDDDGHIYEHEIGIDPADEQTIVDRDHGEWVWVTDGLYFTRAAAQAKCGSREDWRTYGFATKGDLRSIVRQHTEGQS